MPQAFLGVCRAMVVVMLLAGCPAPVQPLDSGSGGGGGEEELDAGAGGGGGTDAGQPDAGRPSDGGCFDFAGELTLGPLADGGLGATLLVDTAAPAEDDDRGPCVTGAAGGRDVFVRLTLADQKLISLNSSAVDGGDVTLYLRAGQCNASQAVACADSAGPGGTERIDRLQLDAGEYYVVLDNFDRSGNGAQLITVTAEDLPQRPANDDCAGGLVLSFDGGVAVATGDTLLATNSPNTPRCSPSAAASGHDVAYFLTVPAGPRQDLTASITTEGALDPVLYLISPAQCDGTLQPDGGTGELACSMASTGALVVSALQPGAYLLWVDGRGDTAGRFTLSVTLRDTPPVGGNDLCTAAVWVLDAGATQSILGVTRANADNSTASCLWGAGKDVSYRFTTSQARRFQATVTPAPDAGYRPAIYLLPYPGCRADGGVDVSGALGCAVAGGVNEAVPLVVSFLDAGTWLLVVDGVAGTSGPFILELELAGLAQAPGNDVCGAASSLPFQTQPWGALSRVTGSTRGAFDDHQSDAGCASAGPDVAFSFTSPPDAGLDGGSITVKASVWSTNVLEANPTLFLEASCDGGNVGCRNPSFGPTTILARNVPAATSYVLWADQATDAGGPFTVQVEVATSAPPNDLCTAAVDLPLDTSVMGNTLGANANEREVFPPDGGFYSGAPLCNEGLPGPELVYRFTTGDAGTYVVRVHPDRNFDPGLAITQGCVRGQCLDTADLGLSGDDEVIVLNAPAATTYYLFVDSFSEIAASGRGGFIVSVEQPCSGFCTSCTSSAQCSNGNSCRQGSCQLCGGKPDCARSQACVVGSCAACVNDTQCDDGDPCTSSDRCASGACVTTLPWQYVATQSTIFAGAQGTWLNLHDTSGTTGAGTDTPNGFLRATFPSAVTVSAVTVSGGALPSYGLAAVYLNGRSLQYSLDGMTWVTVATISGVTDTGPTQFLRVPVVPAVQAANWRLSSTTYLATTSFAFELTDTFMCGGPRACTTTGDCIPGEICEQGSCAPCNLSTQCGQSTCLVPGCGPCTSASQCGLDGGVNADGGAAVCTSGRCL